MAKITLCMAISLDGFIAREDGATEWLSPFFVAGGEDCGFNEFQESTDVVIMGRKTYEGCLKDASRELKISYSEHLLEKNIKCYVFTNKKIEKSQGVEFISGDVVGFVKRLKDQKSKDIQGGGCKGISLAGGSQINSLLLSNGLIDELFLIITPIVLGKGINLFKNISEDITWTSVETRQYGNIVVLKYYLYN